MRQYRDRDAESVRRVVGISGILLYITIKPSQIAFHAIDQQSRLFDAVRSAQVDDHLRRATLPLEGVIQFLALREGHALVALAVLDQRRRRDALEVEQRGAL